MWGMTASSSMGSVGGIGKSVVRMSCASITERKRLFVVNHQRASDSRDQMALVVTARGLGGGSHEGGLRTCANAG